MRVWESAQAGSLETLKVSGGCGLGWREYYRRIRVYLGSSKKQTPRRGAPELEGRPVKDKEEVSRKGGESLQTALRWDTQKEGETEDWGRKSLKLQSSSRNASAGPTGNP